MNLAEHLNPASRGTQYQNPVINNSANNKNLGINNKYEGKSIHRLSPWQSRSANRDANINEYYALIN